VQLTGTGSDPNNDPLTYAWDLDNNGSFETVGQNVTFSAATLDGPGSQTVGLRVCDNKNACATTNATVNLTNVAPTVGNITAPTDPQMVNSTANTSVTFTDPGTLDTHTAVWNWGDGNSSNGTVTESTGSGTVSGTHTYNSAGVYTVTVTVTDKDGGAGTNKYQYVVIYDPSAGFVTGGGTIQSPSGAEPAQNTATGKASFGVSAKYTSSGTPTGVTKFAFPTGNLDFVSTGYDWLVVEGNTAYLTGVGTINGSGTYNFWVSVTDGSPDTFRIRIFTDAGVISYDNQIGAVDIAAPTEAINGGQIKIH
jgi:hypothetical protein